MMRKMRMMRMMRMIMMKSRVFCYGGFCLAKSSVAKSSAHHDDDEDEDEDDDDDDDDDDDGDDGGGDGDDFVDEKLASEPWCIAQNWLNFKLFNFLISKEKLGYQENQLCTQQRNEELSEHFQIFCDNFCK